MFGHRFLPEVGLFARLKPRLRLLPYFPGRNDFDDLRLNGLLPARRLTLLWLLARRLRTGRRFLATTFLLLSTLGGATQKLFNIS